MLPAKRRLSLKVLTLWTLFGFSRGVCPCGMESLCMPLSSPPVEHEVFAFVTGSSWRHFLEYDPHVTTIAFFGTPTMDMVCNAHTHKTRVVLGMSFSQFANSTAAEIYINQSVSKMMSLGIDGFNVDIEGNVAHRDELTAFVKALGAAARHANPHAQITFDLSIFPKGQTKGYDHAALANVLDFIVPMAYDECWGATQAEANSPFSALAKGVQQYIDLGVAADKLVIGLPWYGWDFPCDSPTPYGPCHVTVPEGKKWFGYATQISYSVANITSQHGSQKDETSMTMLTEYFENVNGSELRHQQWFDNPDTLAEKYTEVARLGCRGVAFWTADEVDYTTSQGQDMWAALTVFGKNSTRLVV